MKQFLVLFFLKLIANIETTKPKSVNLALKTVLQFDQKNNAADVKFLDNVQEFLDKVRNVLRNKTARRFDAENKNKNIKFTDFLKSLIDILKSYDDEDLEDVFAVFDNEIRKYHYRGCKFYELVEDQNVRRFVANKLEDIKDKPAEKLRQNLENATKILEDAKFSGPRTEFLDYVNSLYRQDSADKLREFLNNLKTYSKSKRANLNLIKIVQDGIRSVVFDHYSRLNANARRNLKIKLETSWRHPKYPDRVEHKIWTVQYTNSFFNPMKYRNKNDETRDSKQISKETIAIRKPTTNYDSESNDNDDVLTTRYNTNKVSKESETNEVYFDKDKHNKLYDSDNDFKTVTMKSITQDLASESDSDETPTTRKLKPRKLKDKKKHKQRQAQKIAYPKRMTNKRFKIESTTRKARLSTLWEEALKQKAKRSKSTNWRTGVDKPRVIADSETIIDVKRAVSSEDSIEISKGNRETSSTTKRTWQQTKTTQGQYKPTTLNKSRKNLPELSLEDVTSGISIDSFEIKRRSLLDKHNNSNQNEMKRNVLRRINQLEKQMEEVKIKIETKLTTKDTKFALLDSWIGTTKARNATAFTNVTVETTKPTTTNVTTLETTTIMIDSNKSIEMTTEKENITTQTINITESDEDNKKATVVEQNKHNTDIPVEGKLDIDNEVDNIMKKYNISVTATYKPISLDKFLESKPENDKDSKVKELIENDLKKVFGEKTRRSDNAPMEAYQDLNTVLDLGESFE